jgi:Gas vesicle protein K
MEIGDPFAAPGGRRARLELEPGKIERGLVKLVLSLVELIRQLMEKQAMRRIEAGSLSEPEIDRLGRSLMEIESKIRELQVHFEIDDLNLDLGPVGTLIDE